MKKWRLILIALAVAVGLTSSAAADTVAARQRVAITTNGVDDGTFVGKFVLDPLQVGFIKRDEGTERCQLTDERVAMRDGQRVSIYDRTVCTYTGKRGTFVRRSSHEWVAAGNHYFINTGTWQIVRGTGQYAGLTGGGRVAGVWLDRGRGPWSGNAEGFLARP
jgi:hypothetical protein